MLIEIWERLRGYDKWTQTEATILSSDLVGQVSKNVIGWTDVSGKSHTAKYSVFSGSRLYQLYDGQTVTIRYNQANPAEYYFRDLFRYWVLLILFWSVFYVFLLSSPTIDFVSFLLKHSH
jgi:hypothetical protein